MTNGEKYRTVKERTEAFARWCDQTFPENKTYDIAFAWLEKEAENEPLPCPFCRRACEIHGTEGYKDNYVSCTSCEYSSPFYDTEESALVAHNRVAKAAMNSKV